MADSENKNDKQLLNILKYNYSKLWKNLFELADLGDLDKPLTTEILSNPDHKITKHILYLYSMASFVYPDLNRATREKD